MAQYTIPLTLPPGVKGLVPQLALAYNARVGDGLLGMGWSITGFSAISRCNKTIAQDTAASAPTLVVGDGYCLDGNRLRLTGGTYGTASSTYQTELEVYSKVTAVGTVGNGPLSWEVKARNGLIYEYGNNLHSRVEPVGSTTVRLWALSKIRDRNDNYIEFIYDEDAVNGNYWPTEIRYGGNSAVGTTPQAKVVFTYETADRPDPRYGYKYGNTTGSTGTNNLMKRLDKIDVIYTPTSTTTRTYNLTYESAGGAGGRSRLQSLQECVGANCLSATTFIWLNGTPSWNTTETSTGQSVASYADALIGDINGDGRDDLVFSSSLTSGSGTWYYMLGTATGYAAAVNTTRVNYNYTEARAVEWNGDGLMDILVPCNATANWCVMQATGSGFGAMTDTLAAVSGTAAQTFTADLDGDGRDDLVRIIKGSIPHKLGIRLRSGTGFAAENASAWVAGIDMRLEFDFSSLINSRFRSSVRRMDFDGDGRQDFVLRVTQVGEPGGGGNLISPGETEESGQEGIEGGDPGVGDNVIAAAGDVYYWRVFYGRGNTLLQGNDLGLANVPYAADFNGDGLTDLVQAATTWQVLRSRGLGFEGYGTGPPTAGTNVAATMFTDYDGDGLTDIVTPKTSPANWFYARSVGNGFQTLTDTGLAAASTGWGFVADINGDGLFDIARNDTAASNAWKFRMHLGVYPDFLDRATDGFGMYTDFNYAFLSAGGTTYTKGTGAAFPTVEYQGPMYVVSTATMTNGIGGTYTNTHTYEGARLHLQGRGFIGFRKVNVTDSRTSIRNETTFYQNPGEYQALGMVSLVQVKQSSGTVIQEVTNTSGKLTGIPPLPLTPS